MNSGEKRGERERGMLMEAISKAAAERMAIEMRRDCLAIVCITA